MFGPLGGPELLLIFVIALIVFGPRKLPEIGKSLGKMLSEFRRASNDLKRTIEDEVEADRLRQTTPDPYNQAAVPPTQASPAQAGSTPEGGPADPTSGQTSGAPPPAPEPPAPDSGPVGTSTDASPKP